MDSSSGKSSGSRFAICSGLHAVHPAAIPTVWLVPALPGPSPRPDRAPIRALHRTRRGGPARRRGAARWWRASRSSGGGRGARRATARATPDSRAGRSASTRCAAAPARSSTATGRAVGRSRAHRPLRVPDRDVLALRERQIPTRHRRRQGKGSRRQRDGTTGTRPAMTRPPRPRRPRSSRPRAIAAQNLTRSSRHATVGRPGDGICPRYSCTARCRSFIVAHQHLHDRGVATTS